MNQHFRSELLQLIDDAMNNEESFEYINPHLVTGILQSLEDTSARIPCGDSDVPEEMWDWVQDLFGQ